ALQLFTTEPLNIVSDSLYVVGLIKCLPGAFIKELDHKHPFTLCLDITSLLNQHSFPIFILRIHSHTVLPGPIAEGNHQVDALTMPVLVNQTFEQAKLSHSFSHQSASGLQKEFHLTKAQAKAIICACPDCQRIDPVPLPSEGVNV
ncbi:POK18 protein, partial [Bucorvus abyssinicus]|nr:POK18 protein [Bucorvus abyssinicus]